MIIRTIIIHLFGIRNQRIRFKCPCDYESNVKFDGGILACAASYVPPNIRSRRKIFTHYLKLCGRDSDLWQSYLLKSFIASFSFPFHDDDDTYNCIAIGIVISSPTLDPRNKKFNFLYENRNQTVRQEF